MWNTDFWVLPSGISLYIIIKESKQMFMYM